MLRDIIGKLALLRCAFDNFILAIVCMDPTNTDLLMNGFN